MPTQCTGGAMLAVDLSCAFDMVSHHDLFRSMVAAGIPQPITQVILALHNNISYHLRVSQHTASVPVRRGVRQGCILAPHLWNLITSAILQTLSQVLPTEWITRLMICAVSQTLNSWRAVSFTSLTSPEPLASRSTSASHNFCLTFEAGWASSGSRRGL